METKYVRVKRISFDISDDFGFEVDVFNVLEIEKSYYSERSLVDTIDDIVIRLGIDGKKIPCFSNRMEGWINKVLSDDRPKVESLDELYHECICYYMLNLLEIHLYAVVYNFLADYVNGKDIPITGDIEDKVDKVMDILAEDFSMENSLESAKLGFDELIKKV